MIFIFYIFFPFFSNSLSATFSCIQNMSVFSKGLEYFCKTTCYIESMLIGNDSCGAVRVPMLTSYLLNIDELRKINFPNITTVAHRTAFARVFLNYYLKGSILKALFANSNQSVGNISSSLECRHKGLDKGGKIYINLNESTFFLNTETGRSVFVAVNNDQFKNNILGLLNRNVEFDFLFLLNLCPYIADEIYKNRKNQGSGFSIMRKVYTHKKDLVKGWKRQWINWFKYRELRDITLTYGSKDIIFISDYDIALEKGDKSINVVGIFFLVGGAFMLLLMLCCMSIMRRREVMKDLQKK